MEYELKSRSERRARFQAGGVKFRARDVGNKGNKISLIAFEYDTRKAKLIVTNHNTNVTENFTGRAQVNFFEQHLNWNEWIEVTDLNTTPTARYYSISSQIRIAEVTETNLGAFTFSQLFHVPSKLSVKLTRMQSEYAPTDKLVFKPRVREYELVWQTEGRYRLTMQDNPWIEIEGAITQTQPLTMFEERYLKGGEGLPDSPAGYQVSPVASLVILSQTETEDGTLVEVNKVMQWAAEGAEVAHTGDDKPVTGDSTLLKAPSASSPTSAHPSYRRVRRAGWVSY